MEVWNKASITKLVWVVAKRMDLMWVKWVHERYLKNNTWWDYSARQDTCQYWGKLHKVKQEFKWDSNTDQR